MKLVSFIAGGRAGYGVVKGNGIVDLSARFGQRWPTLRDLLAAGGLAEAAAILDGATASDFKLA